MTSDPVGVDNGIIGKPVSHFDPSFEVDNPGRQLSNRRSLDFLKEDRTQRPPVISPVGAGFGDLLRSCIKVSFAELISLRLESGQIPDNLIKARPQRR